MFTRLALGVLAVGLLASVAGAQWTTQQENRIRLVLGQTGVPFESVQRLAKLGFPRAAVGQAVYESLLDQGLDDQRAQVRTGQVLGQIDLMHEAGRLRMSAAWVPRARRLVAQQGVPPDRLRHLERQGFPPDQVELAVAQTLLDQGYADRHAWDLAYRIGNRIAELHLNMVHHPQYRREETIYIPPGMVAPPGTVPRPRMGEVYELYGYTPPGSVHRDRPGWAEARGLPVDPLTNRMRTQGYMPADPWAPEPMGAGWAWEPTGPPIPEPGLEPRPYYAPDDEPGEERIRRQLREVGLDERQIHSLARNEFPYPQMREIVFVTLIERGFVPSLAARRANLVAQQVRSDYLEMVGNVEVYGYGLESPSQAPPPRRQPWTEGQ